MSSTVPTSTARPAYITNTRSAMPATTPRSCVIRTIAAPVLKLTVRQSQQLPAPESAGAGDPSRPREQPENRERSDRLPRSGLTDDGEHLAGCQLEVDAAHGMHEAFLGRQAHVETADLQ